VWLFCFAYFGISLLDLMEEKPSIEENKKKTSKDKLGSLQS
jgi:hypothetical protein